MTWVQRIDPNRLVFIDEAGANIAMGRVARWGAYPTIWCLAGEGTMPYYLSENKERDKALQKTGWTAIARYLRSMDPYGHPITIHPSDTCQKYRG